MEVAENTPMLRERRWPFYLSGRVSSIVLLHHPSSTNSVQLGPIAYESKIHFPKRGDLRQEPSNDNWPTAARMQAGSTTMRGSKLEPKPKI
jgi:hypothetical protein